MVKETDWQTKIIGSARKHGGYGKKWATQLTVGVPDLVLAMPLWGGFLMEVKLFKDLTPNFNRKVKTTEKQKYELKQYEKAGGRSCVGLVTYYNPREVYLTIVNWDTEKFSEAMLTHGATVRWMAGQMFDLNLAMDKWLKGSHYE